MKRFFAVASAALLLAWPAPSYAAAKIRVIVMGDSLMSGYRLQPDEAFPARLERKIREVGFDNVEVLNMSISNGTTLDGVDHLPNLLAKHPDVVILELGSNDAARGIRTDLIYNNLVIIINRLIQSDIYVVVVGSKAPASMGYSYGGQYEKIFETLGKNFQVALYPNVLNGIVGRTNLNLGDNYHPNAKGVEAMVEYMYPVVDAAVRWKWEILRQQQEYEQQYQRDMLQTETGGISPPAAVDAPPVPAPVQ